MISDAVGYCLKTVRVPVISHVLFNKTTVYQSAKTIKQAFHLTNLAPLILRFYDRHLHVLYLVGTQ